VLADWLAGESSAAMTEVEQEQLPLRLGDLPIGAVVFHSLYRLGRVLAKYESSVLVYFVPEFDHRSKTLIREGKTLTLGYPERVAAWYTA
jgi:hypothetical protein